MRNGAQLSTTQVTGPCIVNENINQNDQGQDNKAEEERQASTPFIIFLVST